MENIQVEHLEVAEVNYIEVLTAKIFMGNEDEEIVIFVCTEDEIRDYIRENLIEEHEYSRIINADCDKDDSNTKTSIGELMENELYNCYSEKCSVILELFKAKQGAKK